MQGNEKVRSVRAVAETGSAFPISQMGCLHQWWYKSFAVVWMMCAGGLLFLSSLGRNEESYLGCHVLCFSLSVSHCVSIHPVELQ